MTDTSEEVAKALKLGKERGWRPKWGVLTALALIAVALMAIWALQGGDGPDQRFLTADVRRGDITIIVTATGTVEPTNLVEISSELSGTLRSVNVDHNDEVRAGMVLAELDTTKLEARVNVSQAAYDSAQARVAIAEATLEDASEKYENAVELEKRGITAHQTLVSLRAAFKRANYELLSARADAALAAAELALHKADLDKACICSPIDGVILDRAVDAGQIVASTLSAPVLFTVAEDLTKMELQVDIDEADIGRTRVGHRAIFKVDAYDDREFPAEISEIRFAPKTIDGVVTYKAVLTIDNSDLSLRPGMTATADIVVAEVKDALLVPNAALRYAPPLDTSDDQQERSGLLGMLIPDDADTGRIVDTSTVWVLRDGTAQEIDVTAGDSDGRMTEIIEGDLAEGEKIILDQINE